ncbi:hypothetical protein L2E82_29918 [Cichorium intybus]|uniref:Uncharacterized protein n=1 Tax=Cichorium intybus TaxID=13427 RepID=A0ACB9CZA7_CICIN|nr:hypothetical protein L2E82_29918 [Cichorium intybus]
MSSKMDTKLWLVRCPTCRRVLPEPPDTPVFQCGGCNLLLVATARKQQNDIVDPKGGYGRVYKGILTWGDFLNQLVAVKRLDVTGFQGNKEFHTELTMLSQYQHENIITLIGFCDDNNEMILIYEYASHGSLDTFVWKASVHHLARISYKTGDLDRIIDHRIKKVIKPSTLLKFSAIADQCLQKTREKRPTITEVAFQLKEGWKIQICDQVEDEIIQDEMLFTVQSFMKSLR